MDIGTLIVIYVFIIWVPLLLLHAAARLMGEAWHSGKRVVERKDELTVSKNERTVSVEEFLKAARE